MFYCTVLLFFHYVAFYIFFLCKHSWNKVIKLNSIKFGRTSCRHFAKLLADLTQQREPKIIKKAPRADANPDELKRTSEDGGLAECSDKQKKKKKKRKHNNLSLPLLSSTADLHSSAAAPTTSRMTRCLDNEARPPAVNNKSELRNQSHRAGGFQMGCRRVALRAFHRSGCLLKRSLRSVSWLSPRLARMCRRLLCNAEGQSVWKYI